ncbi:hypothetical protein K8R14_03800 [bacterium]|nr:hypothetical protein [bacterium]
MEEVNKAKVIIPSSSDTTGSVPVKDDFVKGKEYENNEPIPEDLQDRWLRWKCLKCGFVYEGRKPLNVCPKCGNNDLDMFGDVA